MTALVDLPKNEREEMLCTYAALILHDEEVEVTADNISKLVKASGASVEPFMPMLFARALGQCNIRDLITSAGSGAAPSTGAAMSSSVSAAGAQKAEEENKPEEEPEEEEEEEDMGFSLFD